MADLQLQAAQDWLHTLFDHCGLSATVSAERPSSMERLNNLGGHWLVLDQSTLSEAQVSALTGPKGEVLDALQYLVNATLNLGKDTAEQVAYTVDLAGCRERRYLELVQMAETAAAQVRSTGEEVPMQPLPPAERRFIHTLLSEVPDLETYSRGQEPQRHLVVAPKQDAADTELSSEP